MKLMIADKRKESEKKIKKKREDRLVNKRPSPKLHCCF